MASIGGDGDGDGPLGASAGIDGGGEAAGAPGVRHRSMGVIVRELTAAAAAAPKYDRISVNVRGGITMEGARRNRSAPDNSEESITDAHRALQRRIEEMCADVTGGRPTCIKSIRVMSNRVGSIDDEPWIGVLDEEVVGALKYTMRCLILAKPWGIFACHAHGETCDGEKFGATFLPERILTHECIIPCLAAFGADITVRCSRVEKRFAVSVEAWPADRALAEKAGYSVDGVYWRDPRRRGMKTELFWITQDNEWHVHYLMNNRWKFYGNDKREAMQALLATRRSFDRSDKAQDTSELQRMIHAFAFDGFDVHEAAKVQEAYEATRARLDAVWDREQHA